MNFISRIPWIIIIIACLTLGLAPFNPPHVYEKLVMLFKGDLRRFIDWFDLVLHSSPWIVLIMKIISTMREG
ncbi:MAG: RND transporter [Spirochaetes bacterium RBG_16_49_21]|nr:MAG: RND transporter [Spirochaetes bacterium RBG_16_49_21]